MSTLNRRVSDCTGVTSGLTKTLLMVTGRLRARIVRVRGPLLTGMARPCRLSTFGVNMAAARERALLAGRYKTIRSWSVRNIRNTLRVVCRSKLLSLRSLSTVVITLPSSPLRRVSTAARSRSRFRQRVTVSRLVSRPIRETLAAFYWWGVW